MQNPEISPISLSLYLADTYKSVLHKKESGMLFDYVRLNTLSLRYKYLSEQRNEVSVSG
ncbi:MAG: hypothetical protein H8D23_08460 [Candidatus Brocadiales bacterium]|nr:hypothetical protein [Candidatus Brocadiales bacterium]